MADIVRVEIRTRGAMLADGMRGGSVERAELFLTLVDDAGRREHFEAPDDVKAAQFLAWHNVDLQTVANVGLRVGPGEDDRLVFDRLAFLSAAIRPCNDTSH